MALQRDARYPGRWTASSVGHPQGAFKNRTAPGALDGSYIEQDWANDWDGYFSSLLDAAGITADGNVDSVGASQYFAAFTAIIAASSSMAAVTGQTVNIPSASATATFTIPGAIVTVGVGGTSYRLVTLSKVINLATVGVGGMDTGTAPVSGYVAVYLIYNPVTAESALLGVNATSAAQPEVYGGVNMPSGYTASALVSILGTNASSQFKIASQKGRKISFEPVNVLTSVLNQPTFVSLSVAGAVPLNAKHASGTMLGSSSSSTPISMQVASTAGSMDAQQTSASSVLSVGTPFRDIDLLTPQTIFRVNTVGAGTPAFSINMTNFTF